MVRDLEQLLCQHAVTMPMYLEIIILKATRNQVELAVNEGEGSGG